MKKGQMIEGTVERIDFPNKGIVRTEDGVCVVKNALPGQKVKAGINKVRKGKAEGRLLEITEKSPLVGFFIPAATSKPLTVRRCC